MGWASGSCLMGDIISHIKKTVKYKSLRQKIYKGIIVAMEDQDWDTQDECMGEDKAFDAALKEVHPGWFVKD